MSIYHEKEEAEGGLKRGNVNWKPQLFDSNLVRHEG